MKRITDRDFSYVPAAKTDIRKTFARVRRELRETEERRKKDEAEAAKVVRPMKRGG